jgi:hypothetical protein
MKLATHWPYTPSWHAEYFAFYDSLTAGYYTAILWKYGGDERCAQGSGGETWRKETMAETQT